MKKLSLLHFPSIYLKNTKMIVDFKKISRDSKIFNKKKKGKAKNFALRVSLMATHSNEKEQ